MNFVTRFKDDVASIELFSNDTEDDDVYNVEFIDIDIGKVEYSTSCKRNYWAKLDNISNKNITIKVSLNEKVVYQRNRYDKFNSVYILIGSKSLGDNIAWLPYVEEYRKINNVNVLLYTPFEELFFNSYPEIIFTDINDQNRITDVDKKFKIDYGPYLYYINNKLSIDAWFKENEKFDNHCKTIDYRIQPLQQIAALVLGLEYQEIKPKIDIPDEKPKIKGKYVVVAIQSTGQLKYWNNPFGWERLFDFLKRNNYKVVLIDKYKSFGVPGYYNQAPKAKNVIDRTGNKPLSDRIIDIKNADMMITISSGLAWISWAVGTPVVMISGATKPWNEFKSNNIRIHNPNICNGCWNDTNVFFDATNWLFCPKNNNFICSASIQPRDVIDEVKKLMR